MTSHRTGGSSRRPAGSRRKAAKEIKAPRLGPAWYRKRRLATRRRVAAMSRTRRVWRRVGILGTWLLAAVAVLLVVAVFAFYQLSDVVTPDKIKTDQVATIYYRDGSVMAKIGAENRTDVSIDKVPPQVKWAVLAAEDRNYYSNPGISITGTLRAAWNDLSGGQTQGGSGITQQYVKNAYLNADQTLSRKLKELAIAVKLDRNYSKDTILEYYLNTIYFGRGAYGVQAAAQTYFGVDVGKLDSAQGAVLAALIRSPGYYDPAANPGAAKDRFKYVLDGMVSTGHLSRAEADSTAYPKVKAPSDGGLGASGPVALIVNKVKAELEATDGIDESTLNTRGMSVFTTVDPRAQQVAQSAVDQTYGNLAPFQKDIRRALVATDPNTGGVLAYWGGKYTDQDVNGFLDYAGTTCQAPGSSFKPYTLAVGLTNALAQQPHGYTLDTRVDGSSPQQIGGVEINNDPSDAAYESSSISVARAMEVSLNTVFDAMALAVNPDNVAAMAHKVGVQDIPCNGAPSLAEPDGHTNFGIGIGDYPVRTIDQAIGFSTFETGGLYRPAYFVQKVVANDGQVLFQHRDAPKQVIDKRVANDVTVSLGPVADFSLNPLSDGRPSASKTGTVGIEVCTDGSKPDQPAIKPNRNCDMVGQNSNAWTVGFTPSVSVASWAGSGDSTTAIYGSTDSENPRDGQQKIEYGRDLPGKAWKLFTDGWLQGSPVQALPTQALISGGEDTAPRPVYTPTNTPSPTTPPPSTPPVTPSTPRTTPPTKRPTTPPSTPSSPPSTSSPPPSTPRTTPPTTPPAAGGAGGG